MAKRTVRTDLHRPSAIVPADYRFIACDYRGGGALEGMDFAGERAAFRAWMAKTGAKFAHIERDSGGCDICGAYCCYTAKFHHMPTNTVIVTGMDCAEKMDIADPVAFRSFRKRVAAGLKTQRGKRKAQEFLADAGLTAAWDVYTAPPYNDGQPWPFEETTISDIVNKLVRYGSASDGQVNFVRSLLTKIAGRAELAAKRAAEAATAAPVPITDKRIEIVGRVLTTKSQDGYLGEPVLKMLVQTEAGFKVWGTMPRDLMNVKEGSLKGTTVTFSAKVQPSKDDPKFGFFSRPTKARIIQAAVVQA